MPVHHLYIHVPFCARRCVYCDFSIAVRTQVPVDEYVLAVEREWTRRHADTAFKLETVYFGGGTPSRLGAEGVQRLLDVVRARASIAPDAEVTLEANPEDVTGTSAAAWRAAGVNRVSLGVQSFHEPTLNWMHRTHDASAARRAIDVLRGAGIESVSLDLIFALPEFLGRDWDRDLDDALALAPTHVSVYGLTVEPRTPLGRWVANRRVSEAPEERFEREFLRAHEVLTAAGLDHYEVSNYGRADAHARHNSAYWTRAPYAGLGPSAHEFVEGIRHWNVSPYAEWEARARSGRQTTGGTEQLQPQEIAAEEVYLGLRTSTGLKVSGKEIEHAASWIERGWAMADGAWLRLTALGWLRLDALAADLTLFRSR